MDGQIYRKANRLVDKLIEYKKKCRNRQTHRCVEKQFNKQTDYKLDKTHQPF